MTKFKQAARKATATFLFATLGVVVGAPVLDYDIELWQAAAGAGLGAIINLVYRWSESVVKEG